jgi:phage/plasmid-like protein (TIGR03299 family)
VPIIRLVAQWGKPGCKLFGIVGSDYRPLQNIDAFRFFDGIVSTGLVSYETGGALGDGERVWVQARVKGDMDVAGDKIERFLLLSNGHDGKTAVDIRFSPIRVVCQNTLSWALQERSPLFHIHHDQRMDKRIEGAEIAIKDILEEYDRIETKFKKFTTIKLAEPSMVEYFTKVFADPKRYTNERDNTYASRLKKVQSTRENARRLADFGEGNQNHRGTVWAAYNGITELVDHEWGYADPTKRLNFLWFGEGERIKIKALEEASNLCRN